MSSRDCISPSLLFEAAMDEAGYEQNPPKDSPYYELSRLLGYEDVESTWFIDYYNVIRDALLNRVGALDFLEGVRGVSSAGDYEPSWLKALLDQWSVNTGRWIHDYNWAEGWVRYSDPSADTNPEAYAELRGWTYEGQDTDYSVQPSARYYTFTDKKGREVVIGPDDPGFIPPPPKRIKIGKLLKKLSSQATWLDDADIAHEFETRGVDVEWAITADPYEVARMSYGRGWRSCMMPGGAHEQGPITDVKAGSALLLFFRPGKSEPVGREILRPAVEIERYSEEEEPGEPIILRSNVIYGTGGRVTDEELAEAIIDQTGIDIAIVSNRCLGGESATDPNDYVELAALMYDISDDACRGVEWAEGAAMRAKEDDDDDVAILMEYFDPLNEHRVRPKQFMEEQVAVDDSYLDEAHDLGVQFLLAYVNNKPRVAKKALEELAAMADLEEEVVAYVLRKRMADVFTRIPFEDTIRELLSGDDNEWGGRDIEPYKFHKYVKGDAEAVFYETQRQLIRAGLIHQGFMSGDLNKAFSKYLRKFAYELEKLLGVSGVSTYVGFTSNIREGDWDGFMREVKSQKRRR